jgi:ATP-dependent DNA helicase RecG
VSVNPTGTEDIVKRCKDMDLKQPVFIQDTDFRIVLYKNHVEETVEKTVEKILGLIAGNPQITQAELAEMTGLTRRGIEWNLSRLKDQGLLERVGPDKGGYWKALGEDGPNP